MKLALKWVTADPITPFQIAQLCLIASGLIFTVVQLRRTARAARVANLLTLTKNHRELWTMLLNDPTLRSVLFSSRALPTPAELSVEERLLVNFFILHMATGYELQRAKMITRNKATAADIAELISLPAFRALWAENMKYHTPKFRRFVNRALTQRDQMASRN